MCSFLTENNEILESKYLTVAKAKVVKQKLKAKIINLEPSSGFVDLDLKLVSKSCQTDEF